MKHWNAWRSTAILFEPVLKLKQKLKSVEVE